MFAVLTTELISHQHMTVMRDVVEAMGAVRYAAVIPIKMLHLYLLSA